jgi:hypothetical protein
MGVVVSVLLASPLQPGLRADIARSSGSQIADAMREEYRVIIDRKALKRPACVK